MGNFNLGTELRLLVQHTDAFGDMNLDGRNACHEGSAHGARAAEQAPLDMRLTDIAGMACEGVSVETGREESSRESDIRELSAVVTAFAVRQAKRKEEVRQ